MFNTIDSFTAFYIPLSLLLVLMVLFKEPLLRLEAKYDKWKENRRNEHLH